MAAKVRRVYRDPITNDILTRSEWLSWQLQTNVIRRWSFLVGFTIVTLACVCTGSVAVITWWNVLASYLAIFVESIVGRAMFGQTRRDAQILREIRSMEVEDNAHHEHEDEIEGDLLRMVTVLYRDYQKRQNN